MTDYLKLADARILIWLNHALAGHPRLFVASLLITDKLADLAVLAMGAVLWVWPHRIPGWRAAEPDAQASVAAARRASRARLIVFGLGATAAYVTARLIAMHLDKPRPFASYLPVLAVPGAFFGLREFGTFPSDHAALLGALPVAFACWSVALGWIWAVAALLLLALRVAVAFHYPYDMIAGGLIGAVFTAAAMALYDRNARVHGLALDVAGHFSRRPHAYVLYGLLAAGALEFAFHFTHVLAALLWLRARL